MKMRVLTGIFLFVGLGGLTACQSAVDDCNKVNNCFRDASGIPTCTEGYAWEDPSDNLNLVCVDQATAGQGTQGGTSGNMGTGTDSSGGNSGTNTDTSTDNGTTDSSGCPANSHIGNPANGEEAEYCYCDDGYALNTDQTGCVESGTSSGGSDGSDGASAGSCPENAHTGDPANGEEAQYCYCDDGYSVNADQTGCEAECEVDADCADGNVCIDNTCRPPPCTADSCPAGSVCNEDSGFCIQDLGTMPPQPNLECDVLPASSCEEDDFSCIPSWECSGAECGQLVAFSPRMGDHYWDYTLNGETDADQYRSFIRGDVRNLVEYSSAWVRCMTEGRWDFGNGAELALGDMSESNGDIPGTREASPGHPAGTHVGGSDMDIGYYQTQYDDNRLRSICEHVENGQDQYHCVSEPTNLDIWRSALVLAKMHDSPHLRVIGVDGKAGLLMESAITQMCSSGWISGSACTNLKLAYEVTDGGAGWYRFHHHHFHISVNGSKSARSSENQFSLVPDALAYPLPMTEEDPRRLLYRELKPQLRD